MLKVLAIAKNQVVRDALFPVISEGTKALDGKRLDKVDLSIQLRCEQDVDDLIKFLQVTRVCFKE